ncbi:precorrin-3B C(17)-methyltransferase [Coleofasciculus sp. H7-2]|uniref:precorrin-3B C(17)-methyltransferase n=1 Tax=Coleofasciculus sp. H7-2 TaxID=3351545 RepID=UPI00366E3119
MVLLLGDFQPLAAIATTPTGAEKLQPLCQSTGATLWVPESLTDVVETKVIASAQVYRGSLKDHLATLWNTHRGFIFCLASGAVVRLIAPLLQDKSRDPAVVVVDENSQFVISLCSGHQGGADRLAQAIALTIGATPVLTGASAGLKLPAVDMLGVPFGWSRGEGDWTGVSAAVARGERVQVIQEAGSTLWQSHLPEKHPFYFGFPESTASQSEIVQSNQEPDRPKSSPARIWISPTRRRFSSESELPKVQWHPRVLWVGIGCERGTSKELIETAIGQVFEKNHLAEEAIAGIATIDIKASEIGLVELCRDRHLPLRTFSADILRSVSVPTPSAVVEAEVGTPSVAEAAAIVGAGLVPALHEGVGHLGAGLVPALYEGVGHLGAGLVPALYEGVGHLEAGLVPTLYEGVGHPQGVLLRVAKQVFKLEGQPGAVTVAIAQSELEYTGRTGCLLLVGTGPGKLDQMTPAAQTAVSCADAIIGYSLYIDLISPLLRPGQIVEALPITQERQRAERAIELANWGLTVAVVSSGDCGIYGMAGLVMEELQAKGWDGKTPGVQVFPGITALQAAASRVGAPLMHDFCAISLSDLLTPWEVIEKRLSAAAQADFVTALYNPRSQTRTKQIAIAQTIFLQYRDRHTPVAIVKSAYREDEQITLITLDKLLDTPIDMLTTVLIGNSTTRTHADWMITPRGYLGFDAEIR